MECPTAGHGDHGCDAGAPGVWNGQCLYLAEAGVSPHPPEYKSFVNKSPEPISATMTLLFFVGILLAVAGADATDKIWGTRRKVTNLIEADDALSTITARLDTIDTRYQDFEDRWKIGSLNVNHRPTLRGRRRALRKAREELVRAMVNEWDPAADEDAEVDADDIDNALAGWQSGDYADYYDEGDWNLERKNEYAPTADDVPDDDLAREDLGDGRP